MVATLAFLFSATLAAANFRNWKETLHLVLSWAEVVKSTNLTRMFLKRNSAKRLQFYQKLQSRLGNRTKNFILDFKWAWTKRGASRNAMNVVNHELCIQNWSLVEMMFFTKFINKSSEIFISKTNSIVGLRFHIFSRRGNPLQPK